MTSPSRLSAWRTSAGSVVDLADHLAREIRELLPRYAQDNLFDSARFKQRFPAFEVMSYRDGIDRIFRKTP